MVKVYLEALDERKRRLTRTEKIREALVVGEEVERGGALELAELPPLQRIDVPRVLGQREEVVAQHVAGEGVAILGSRLDAEQAA